MEMLLIGTSWSGGNAGGASSRLSGSFSNSTTSSGLGIAGGGVIVITALGSVEGNGSIMCSGKNGISGENTNYSANGGKTSAQVVSASGGGGGGVAVTFSRCTM